MTEQATEFLAADVVIAGGGMVGISLALLLTRKLPDATIVLVEQAPISMGEADDAPSPEYSASFDARSTAISESSRALLQQLELWQKLSQHLTAIDQVHVSDRGHIGSTMMTAQEQGLPALGYVLENQWLGRVLLDALKGEPSVKVVSPVTVSQARALRDGIQLVLSSGQTLSASLLVVADGANSSTRQLLGISHEVQRYGQSAIVANVSLGQPHQQIAYERFTDTGPVALLPLEDHLGQPRSALVWTVPTAQSGELLAMSDDQLLGRLQDWFGYRLGRLQGLGERSSYPLQLVTSDELYRRNLVVVGNAATALHPVAGQGFNLALRGISLLAGLLESAWADGKALGDLALLQEYGQQHQRDRQRIVTFSDALPRVFGSDSVAVALGRNLGLLALDAAPGARKIMASLGTGTLSRTGVFRG